MQLPPPLDALYRDARPLGAGGQARVFLATRVEGGEAVAVKLLHWDAPASARDRLRREAMALASLRHPHLVRFLDVHLDLDPPALVMEAIQGRDLRHHLDGRGAFPPERAREISQALASALAFLHAKGCVHRDVKPENVLLTADRGPVLVDLGLVSVEGAEALTRTGAVVGTPLYTAPETYAGDPGTPATDVFSLGLLLHECLTGRRAFEVVELMAAGRGGSLPPDPPAALQAAFGPRVAATLAADPRDRPAADEVARALGASEVGSDAAKRGAGEARAPAPPRRPSPLPSSDPRPTRDAPGTGRARPWMVGLFLACVALGLLWPSAPPALTSLRLEPDPFGVRLRWDGAELGPTPVEVVAGEVVIATLDPGVGARHLDLPLEGPTRLRLRREGVAVPVGEGAAPEVRAEPAALPGPEAARLVLGPGGLEVHLDWPGPFTPRLALRTRKRRWWAEVREASSARVAPLERALVDPGFLQVDVAPPFADAVRDAAPLARWDLEPGVRMLSRTVYTSGDPARVPAVEDLKEGAALAPVPYDPSATANRFDVVTIFDPGGVRAELGGKTWTLLPGVDDVGPFLLGLADDLEADGLLWPLPDGFLWASDFHVEALSGGVALRGGFSDPKPHLGRGWLTSHELGQMDVHRLAPLDGRGSGPRAGPLRTPDGGAVLVYEDLRLQVAGPDGRLEPLAPPPGGRTFFPRRAGRRTRGRWAVLGGYWGPWFTGEGEPPGRGLLLVDLAEKRIRGGVSGLPGNIPAPAVVVDEGGEAVAYLVSGADEFRLDLAAFLAQRPPDDLPVDAAVLLSSGVLQRRPLLEARDHRARDHIQRGSSRSVGPWGVMGLLEPARDAAGNRGVDLSSGLPLDHWQPLVRLYGPEGATTVAVSDGPFPAGGPWQEGVSVDLDVERGLAAALAETAEGRFTLDLLALQAARPVIRWSLRPPPIGILAPTLSGPGTWLMLFGGKALRYPHPLGPGAAP